MRTWKGGSTLRIKRKVVFALRGLVITSLALVGISVSTQQAAAAATADWLPLKGMYSNAIGCTWDNGCDDGYHGGSAPAIDFSVPYNTPVYAAGAGTVVDSNNTCHPSVPDASCSYGRGRFVEIAHPDGRHSRYLHLSSVVRSSGTVAIGELIGYTGKSGYTTYDHLHYDELVGGVKVDPGFMKAVQGTQVVSYPSKLGLSSWNELGAFGGHTIQNDSYTEPTSAPPDSDSDNVVDSADTCPGEVGDPVHNGCLFEQESVLTLEADINHDNYDDVVMISRGYSDNVALYWAPNNQNGTFGSPQALTTLNSAYWKASELKFFTADYTGDGYTDLLAANGSLTASSIYIYGFASNGSTLNSPVNLYTLPRSAWQIEMTRFVGADISGDGRDDVVAINRGHYNDVALYVLKSNLSGTLDAPQALTTLNSAYWKASELKFFTADYNGDNKADVLAANGTATSTSTYIYGFASNGSTLNSPVNLLTLPGSSWRLSTLQFLTEDVNNDGRSDVVALSHGPLDEIAPYWLKSYVNSGADVLDTPASLITLSPSAWKASELKFFTGDFNADNKADLLAANWSASSPSMYIYGFASNGSTSNSPINMLTLSGSAWPLARTQY
jgi:hypothetical protein